MIRVAKHLPLRWRHIDAFPRSTVAGRFVRNLVQIVRFYLIVGSLVAAFIALIIFATR